MDGTPLNAALGGRFSGVLNDRRTLIGTAMQKVAAAA